MFSNFSRSTNNYLYLCICVTRICLARASLDEDLLYSCLSPVFSVYAHDVAFVAMSGRVNRLNVSCTEVYRLAMFRMEEFTSRQRFHLLHSGHQIHSIIINVLLQRVSTQEIHRQGMTSFRLILLFSNRLVASKQTGP